MLLTRLVRDVVDFCYPGACAVCRGSCEPSDFLCPPCESRLSKLESAAGCPRCGAPISQIGAPCPFCKDQGVPHYERIVRLGTFEDPLKELIHQFKYHRRWNVGERLVLRMLHQPHARELLRTIDVVVPVPLHVLRQLSRGYNQATVLARRLDKPIARPLRRTRNTPTQTHLHSREKRFSNLQGAFKLISPKSVQGKRVLVVDDVTTTGATLQTVARALRPARPASLSALVLAVADPHSRDFQAV